VLTHEEVPAVLSRLDGCEALVERGQDIRTIQELLSHKDVNTTMIDTHVLNQGALGVRSPAGLLKPQDQLILGPVNHG